MRRIPSPRIVTLLVALTLLGSACGALADTTAATVAGRDVSIESVEGLLNDDAFVELVLGVPASDEAQGRVSGDSFRTILAFQLEREAWLAEAERWGVKPDIEAARTQLDQELEAEGSDWQASSRTAFAEYRAAQVALQERFARIDPTNNSDLRLVYDGAPSLWDRVCAAIVQVPEGQADEVRAALGDGASLEELPGIVEGAALAADPSQQCIAESQLPEDLAAALHETPTGQNSAPVKVSDGQGGEVTYVYRVDERKVVSFTEAQEELAGITGSLAQQGPQAWIALIVADADIDPRFGSGVTTGQQGPVIAAPPVPLSAEPAVVDPFAPPVDDHDH